MRFPCFGALPLGAQFHFEDQVPLGQGAAGPSWSEDTLFVLWAKQPTNKWSLGVHGHSQGHPNIPKLKCRCSQRHILGLPYLRETFVKGRETKHLVSPM